PVEAPPKYGGVELLRPIRVIDRDLEMRGSRWHAFLLLESGPGSLPYRAGAAAGARRSSRSGRRASPAFLQDPAVAVGVAEVSERVVVAALRVRARHPLARLDMPDLADIHPAFDELGTRSLDVGDDQVCAPNRARRG